MKLEQVDLRRIQALRQFANDHGVLSVYVPIDPATALHHGYDPQLMDALQEVRDKAPQEQRERIQAESEAILAHVRGDYTPHGTALAVFSCLPAKLLEAFSFQLPVPALARFDTRPFMQPIDAWMDDYPAALIALVSHEEARIINIELGELAGAQHIRSDVPGKQRQGGWSAFRYQRDQERHVHEHMKSVAAAIEASAAKLGAEYVVLAGADESTHALAGVLPEPVRAKLAGSFRGEMFATEAELVDRAREVIGTAARARERALAEELVDLALAGGKAALGNDETMQMLREGRARSLVIAEAALGTPAGEQAAALAWQTGLELEVVHGVAEAALAPYDGIAASLRY